MPAASSVKRGASCWYIHIIAHLSWKFKRTLHEKLSVQKAMSMASEESWTEHSPKKWKCSYGTFNSINKVFIKPRDLIKEMCCIYVNDRLFKSLSGSQMRMIITLMGCWFFPDTGHLLLEVMSLSPNSFTYCNKIRNEIPLTMKTKRITPLKFNHCRGPLKISQLNYYLPF